MVSHSGRTRQNQSHSGYLKHSSLCLQPRIRRWSVPPPPAALRLGPPRRVDAAARGLRPVPRTAGAHQPVPAGPADRRHPPPRRSARPLRRMGRGEGRRPRDPHAVDPVGAPGRARLPRRNPARSHAVRRRSRRAPARAPHGTRPDYAVLEPASGDAPEHHPSSSRPTRARRNSNAVSPTSRSRRPRSPAWSNCTTGDETGRGERI